MNMADFILRNGGNMIVSYEIDGQDVDETTYKNTQKVEENVKKSVFMGNIYVTYRGTTQKEIDRQKELVEIAQRRIDFYLDRQKKHGKSALPTFVDYLLCVGDIIEETTVNTTGKVYTVEFNNHIYLVAYTKYGITRRSLTVKKIK